MLHCVQSVLHLQPHTLEVSFATLHCFINYALVKLVPFLSNPVSYLVDIFTACLVYPFLQYAPDLVVHWVEIGAVGWPQIWWNEVWRLDFQEFDSFASPICWGSVLLKCEVIRVLLNIGQKISRKQYVSIILTIHFNAGINEGLFAQVPTHQPTPCPIWCTLAECGEDDQLRVWLQVEDALNIRCDVYHLWYFVSAF